MFQDEPRISLSQIAKAVLQLSDFYIQYPEATTPWDEEFCQIAYRHYFLPLNFQRNQRVVAKAQQVGFFEGLSYFVDWGCGPGTASLALSADVSLKPQMKKQVLIDQSDVPMKVFEDLHGGLVQPEKCTDGSLKRLLDQKDRSCLVFSYSLTEVDRLPAFADQFEALMILEPSTSDDGRWLMEQRQQLIAQGYSIWGPCTHQQGCPLLLESKSDWCHDRVEVIAPDWFLELEQHLPMRNRTITTSYLLARKKKAPTFSKNIGRLVGDSREEKGKTRQMFCRGEKREFLTWMHKQIAPQTFPRGELARLPAAYEEKSNELRVQQECELLTGQIL